MNRITVIRLIACKELTDNFRERRFRWLFGIVVLLTICSVIFGVIQIKRLTENRNTSTLMDLKIWNSQGAKNPHAAAHFGQYAFKPWSPLSLADPGISFYEGTVVWVEAHKQNSAIFMPARDRGIAGRSATLTLAFVLQKLLPLVIILLAFSAFTGERERGTLRQLFSLGVSSVNLLAGKGIAFLIMIAIFMFPVLLCAAGSLWLFRNSTEFPITDLISRTCYLSLSYTLFLIGWLALAMMVSACTKTSKTALITLLGFWVLSSFVVPRIMSDLIKNNPVLPTALEFSQEIAEKKKRDFGHNTDHPAYKAFLDSVLNFYKVDSESKLPVNMRGLALRRSDEVGYAIYDSVYSNLFKKIYAQDLHRCLPGILFPTLAIEFLSMGFTGSDNQANYHFISEVEKHRRVIQTLASGDLIHNAKYADTRYVASLEFWSKIPPFAYTAPPIRYVKDAKLPVLLILAGWMLLTLTAASVSVRYLRPL
jgi:ABC-2 type transport system permease protein